MTQMQLMAVGSLEPSQAPNRALAARDSERPGARRDRPGISHEVPSERPFADHLKRAESQRHRSSGSPEDKQRSRSEGPVSEEASQAPGHEKGKQWASGEASGDNVQLPEGLAPSALDLLADASTDSTALASPSEVEAATADGRLLEGTGYGPSIAENGTESVGAAGAGQVGAALEGGTGTIGAGQQRLAEIDDGSSLPKDGADAASSMSDKAVASSELTKAPQDKGGAIKESAERGSGQGGNWQMQGSSDVRAAEAKANPEQQNNAGQLRHPGAGDTRGTALTGTSGEGPYQAVPANAASGTLGTNPAQSSREGQAQTTDETGQGSITLENDGAISEIEMVAEGGADDARVREPKGSSVPEAINDDIEKAMAGPSPNHEVTEATGLTNRPQPIVSNQAFDAQSATAKGTGELAADPQPPGPAETTIEPQEVMKEVVTRTRMVRNGESSAMIIRLKPEHLGEVRVEIRVTGNQVSAHFATPSRDVQDVLMQNIQQLRTAFAGRDLNLTAIDVSRGNDGDQESGGNHASQTQHQDQNSRGHGQRPGRGQAESGWVLPQGWQQAVGANAATVAGRSSRQSPYGPGSGMVNYRV